MILCDRSVAHSSCTKDDSMSGDLTRADKKKVRQLAGIAWERELRSELIGIAVAINEMENGLLSPLLTAV